MKLGDEDEGGKDLIASRLSERPPPNDDLLLVPRIMISRIEAHANALESARRTENRRETKGNRDVGTEVKWLGIQGFRGP